jgi:hypothetical protein
MGLLACRDTCCVVALFVDDRQVKPGEPEQEKPLRAFMEAVRERFTTAYSAQVESLRPTLKDLADGKNQVRTTGVSLVHLRTYTPLTVCTPHPPQTLQIGDIQKQFAEFERVVLELREKYVPDTGVVVSPPTST